MASERSKKASSGRAFFAYFLCTSKESMSPIGEMRARKYQQSFRLHARSRTHRAPAFFTYAIRHGGVLVYCFALMGAYRASQFVSGKAPFAGNSGALAKSGNAVGRELARSLRASRQKAVRGVAFPRHRPTMPSKMRRAAHLLATR